MNKRHWFLWLRGSNVWKCSYVFAENLLKRKRRKGN